jgi:hypothetical protein
MFSGKRHEEDDKLKAIETKSTLDTCVKENNDEDFRRIM